MRAAGVRGLLIYCADYQCTLPDGQDRSELLDG